MSSIIHRKKVLFLALSGIGNLLMQLPTIEALKKARPSWHVTLWVAPRGTKPLAQAIADVDQVIEGKIKHSLLGHLQQTYRLAKQKPDIALMLSPGQLWKGAAYMFLTGANQRIAHRYPHIGNPTSAFLLTDSILEEENLHDIEQNLNLLAPLEIPVDHLVQRPYHFNPPPANTRQAEQIFKDLYIPAGKKVIGFHAGCAPDFLWKRWPEENFAHVAKALIANHEAHILIFGGPDEKKQKLYLQKMIGSTHTSLISADLLTTAALMKHCRLFLANDSGLMHLAAAGGVPTFGIFGPTDEKKTGPRGPKSHVIRAKGTKPTFHTESNYDLGTQPHETLRQVSPEQVLTTLQKHLV